MLQYKKTPPLPALLSILAVTALMLLTGFASASGEYLTVRNLPRTLYKGGTQNWMARQDSAGRMYFGNSYGLLIYDGLRWEKHRLPNFSSVRAIHISESDGRIYAAGSEEFGYFSRDSLTGQLHYTSLLPTIHEKVRFSEIWNIFASRSHVWFQADNYLFRYDGHSTVVFPFVSRLTHSNLIDNSIFLAFKDGHITRFQGSRAEALPGCEELVGKKIVAILPFPDSHRLLVVTAFNGLYLYANSRLSPLESDISAFLKENQTFSATCTGDNYAFGTVAGGAVIKNFANGTTFYIDRENGLSNQTVLSESFDKSGNLWLCLDDGLAYAVYNTPFTELLGRSHPLGAGYASMVKGDRIYLGTNQGLYSAPWDGRHTAGEVHLELRGQVWGIDTVGNDLFVSSDGGLHYLAGNYFRRVEGIDGAYAVRRLPRMHNMALVSAYDNFHRLERTADGWVAGPPIKGYEDIGGRFEIDRTGKVWISHWMKGIYRLTPNESFTAFERADLFDHRNGLPTDNRNAICLTQGGEILFSTEGPVYSPDKSGKGVVVNKRLSDVLHELHGASLHSLRNGRLVLAGENEFTLINAGPGGEIVADPLTFRAIAPTLIPGYTHISQVSESKLVVAHQDGFWNVDLSYHDPSGWRPKAFVSRVTANRDSVVYSAATHDSNRNTLSLPFDLNSIKIDFAYPEYASPGGVTFSSLLEGYDADWTEPTTEASREYTRLPEGNYTLHLRAANSRTGEQYETEFKLRILPPWYRTIVARIIYAILTAAACWWGWILIRNWSSRRERLLKEQKEGELSDIKRQSEKEALKKDIEIASLKSEQLERDIRHKGEELSNLTMSLVQKNEILQDLSAKVEHLHNLCDHDAGSSVIKRQLGKIKTTINDAISQDDALTRLDSNFDLVYENFTRTLLSRHPDITPAEKRICCYIKMGLSSKEIAPLVNISYRSVEMVRYRLRKKIGLTREESLTTYLQNL